jgi:hypothetical protein
LHRTPHIPPLTNPNREGIRFDGWPAIQQAIPIKANFQIPGELYREVKAAAAREGLTLREVAIGLFEQWLRDRKSAVTPLPSLDWRNFKAPLAHLVSAGEINHSMETMREHIVENWNEPS